MTTKAKRSSVRSKPMTDPAVVSALVCVARLVKELAPTLPSGAAAAGEDFCRQVDALRAAADV